MSSSNQLVLLKLHVQDRTGHRRAISGFVREGITLLEGIMDVVKQHGGNCNVEFSQEMMKHYLKEVEIGGIRLKDWIQFYSMRGGESDSEVEMCVRFLRNSEVLYENLTSIFLSGAEVFNFFLRDDVGMTKALPDDLFQLLDADSVRSLNAKFYDGVSTSVHPASSNSGAMFFAPNDARSIQYPDPNNKFGSIYTEPNEIKLQNANRDYLLGSVYDANVRNTEVYKSISQTKAVGGGSAHRDDMDAKLIQQKESEIYIPGTFNPSTNTASIEKQDFLLQKDGKFSGKDEFVLQQLTLQNLSVQSIQLQAPAVSSLPISVSISASSGGSQNSQPVQSQHVHGTTPSSFRSDFLPFVSASSETVNTTRAQFLSENAQTASASQSVVSIDSSSFGSFVSSVSSKESPVKQTIAPATTVQLPTVPSPPILPAVQPTRVLQTIQSPFHIVATSSSQSLRDFVVRVTISTLLQSVVPSLISSRALVADTKIEPMRIIPASGFSQSRANPFNAPSTFVSHKVSQPPQSVPFIPHSSATLIQKTVSEAVSISAVRSETVLQTTPRMPEKIRTTTSSFLPQTAIERKPEEGIVVSNPRNVSQRRAQKIVSFARSEKSVRSNTGPVQTYVQTHRKKRGVADSRFHQPKISNEVPRVSDSRKKFLAKPTVKPSIKPKWKEPHATENIPKKAVTSEIPKTKKKSRKPSNPQEKPGRKFSKREPLKEIKLNNPLEKRKAKKRTQRIDSQKFNLQRVDSQKEKIKKTGPHKTDLKRVKNQKAVPQKLNSPKAEKQVSKRQKTVVSKIAPIKPKAAFRREKSQKEKPMVHVSSAFSSRFRSKKENRKSDNLKIAKPKLSVVFDKKFHTPVSSIRTGQKTLGTPKFAVGRLSRRAAIHFTSPFRVASPFNENFGRVIVPKKKISTSSTVFSKMPKAKNRKRARRDFHSSPSLFKGGCWG